MKNIQTPLKDDVVKHLKAGDRISLSGIVYTARDQAHKRLCQLIENKSQLPIDLKEQIIYYTGPTPAQKEAVIGSCGPTTSHRMDDYTIPLLQTGLKGMIGKGKRNDNIEKAMSEYNAIYFIAIGGLGALLSSYVKKCEEIAFMDLGTESIKKLTVEAFPLFVANDAHGVSIFS
ncbi:FumA C-terminus/TtdB family hydratase beta subunit [Chlamydiota bacterium]